MSWQPEVNELNRRLALTKEMGGPERIARQRRQGKLTARERIDALVDAGSFREFMGLGGTGRYDGKELVAFTPKPFVDGTARIDDDLAKGA